MSLLIVCGAIADDDGFKPLFNGQNLEGWQLRQARKGQESTWSMKDGVVSATPGSGWLGTKQMYGDFVLRIEWKIAEGGNSGVFLRVPDTNSKDSPSTTGFEIQVLDDNSPKYKGKLKPYQFSGGLYHFLAPTKQMFKGAGQWNEFEITCRGERIQVVYNGERVIDADLTSNPAMSKRPKRGFIGLQNHGTAVEYRNARIKILDTQANSTPKSPLPNVVIVYADDLGYGDLGCYGNKAIRTPNIDRMAAEGIRFTDFYVAQAVCSASRTALLTGCYPNRVGILGALGPSAKHGIHENEMTIAELLKQRDYATAIYGKWHLGHHSKYLPAHHGFDDYYGLPYSNDMWPQHPTAKFPDLPLIEGEKTIALNPAQTKLTTAYTERAVAFIEKNKGRPFFVYVPHAMPHVPLHVSERHHGKSAAGLYGDVIEEIDWSVGEIMRALKRHGLEKNTLVIFTSDNGPWLSYGNHGGSAGPLREGKGTTFEGGVRVPCVACWPGRISPGTICKEPAMTIDFLPTLAALTGAELPKHPIDGRDITSLVTAPDGAKSPHEALYFYWGRQLQAIRSGPWKFHFAHQHTSLDGKPGGRDGKPAPYTQKAIGESLYDLNSDIGETRNVASQNPEVVAKLKALADKAREELGDTTTKQPGKGVRPAGSL
jgi:arylsulfatase A-like enzyme